MTRLSEHGLASVEPNGRPPLGVLPREVWTSMRIGDLCRALHDHAQAGCTTGRYARLMQEWARELIDHLETRT